MNNILQGIQSGTELIEINLNSLETERAYEILKIIFKEVQRGVRLINNIRTFSQLESEGENLYPIDICDILSISKKNLLETYQDKNIRIKFDFKDDEIYVQANEFLLEVFQNLLVNAIVFNDHKNIEITIKITTEIQKNTEFIKVQIIDNGIGVEDNRKEIIFQRTENIDKQITGLGLGLSLVKKIIENYDGRIWVEDRVEGDPTRGSNFIILIPKVEGY